MKISFLLALAQAAEAALPYLQGSDKDTKAAIEAAFVEASKRLKARKLYRASRPSRTVRREYIRKQLASVHHKVRLTRTGQWHVQTAPGSAWLLFALSDGDAEELLCQPQACGCRFKHSQAAGVIDACLAG